MPRKRDAYTRARDRRKRPRTRAPTEGFVIRDVARLTGVSIRTLRSYVALGLLRHTELRGVLTRYPKTEVLRLLVALGLKAQTKATWAELKRKLDALTPSALEAWLAQHALASPAVQELGIAPPPAPPPVTDEQDPWFEANEWHRALLLPGLELFLSTTASPTVQAAARRIVGELRAQHGGGGF